MKCDKEAEMVFRQQYLSMATSLNNLLLEYADALVETMKNHGELESFTKREHFEDFAKTAFYMKSEKLISENKGQHDALQAAKDLLEE